MTLGGTKGFPLWKYWSCTGKMTTNISKPPWEIQGQTPMLYPVLSTPVQWKDMYIFSGFLSAVVSQKYSVLQCGNTGVMSIKSWVCMEFCQDSATDENPKFFFYYPPQKYWCFLFVFVIVNCSNNHIFHTAMCWFSQPTLRLMLNIVSSLSIVF